jgi:hypothetical protein
MDDQPLPLELGTLDVASLHTEEDFRKAARGLLPQVLDQLGRSRGERQWDDMRRDDVQRGHKGRPSSPQDKKRFVEEMGRNYLRQAHERDREVVAARIVSRLKELKAEQQT